LKVLQNPSRLRSKGEDAFHRSWIVRGSVFGKAGLTVTGPFAAALLTVSVMAGGACAAPRAQPIPIAGVYAGLFEATFHGTPAVAMLVAGSAEPMPTIGGSGALASWLAEFDELPIASASGQPADSHRRQGLCGGRLPIRDPRGLPECHS